MKKIIIDFNKERKVSLNGRLVETYNVNVTGEATTEEVLESLNTIKSNSLKPITKRLTELKKDKAFKRVLIIGDIHEPFSHDDYMEFCKYQYDKYKCDEVVFIGDIIDNHFSSFHPTDPDGYGAGEELKRAIAKIQKWYKVFPKATVIIGNHDRLAFRKAFASGVSRLWLKNYEDVLNTPNWNFVDKIVIDDVLYIHGEAGTATNKAKDITLSVVQGHLHSQAYVNWINNAKFAMQVGTGIDDSKYAFGYNKAGKESILSCGIVLEGKQPLLIKM